MRNKYIISYGSNTMGLLFVALTVLKLLGKISISWWWVTAPLWGPLLLALVGTFIALVIYLIVCLFKK